MPGKSTAANHAKVLEDAVADLAEGLELEVKHQVRVGRRLWGSERKIDLVLRDSVQRKSIGIECKYQGVSGSVDEKIPATIADIAAWPIPGLVVFQGEGFSQNMRSYLLSTGRAVHFDDLEAWLRLFFGLPLP